MSDDKRALRASLISGRRSIPSADRGAMSRRIAAHVDGLLDQAPTVFVYASIGAEVETIGLIASWLERGRVVLTPRVTGPGEMEAVSVLSLDGRDAPGWLAGLPAWSGPIDWAVVPCVGVTARGHRLGRGGGYYDRWLARRPGVRSAALAYPMQVVPRVPVEPHDRPVGYVVSPAGVIETGAAR